MTYKKWLSNLANKVCRLRKKAAREDVSLPPLTDLLRRGYTVVIWDAGNTTHSQCRELNQQQWELAQFLTGLEHSAPIFEHSHVGCYCTVIVRGDGLNDVVVDSYGNSY
jgi:hypothetical protein